MSIMKSNAFVGLEQYQRMQDEAIRATEEASLPDGICLGQSSKRKKSLNVSIGLNTNILRHLQDFSNENKKVTTKSKQFKHPVPSKGLLTDSFDKKTKLNFKMAADAANYSPLVKSDAFVGLAQYHERLRSMDAEARILSETNDKLKRKATSELEMNQSAKIQKTSNGPNQRWNKISLKTNYKIQKVTPNNEKIMQHSANQPVFTNNKVNGSPKSNLKMSTETVIYLPVVRSNELAEMEQYRASLQTFYDDSICATNREKSTDFIYRGMKKTSMDANTTNDTKSSNALKTSIDDKTSNDTNELEGKIETTPLSKISKIENILARSEKMRRSMPFDRLLRMDKAVQEWNSCFNTSYSLLEYK